ncbi:MAG: pyrroline-5-carboxylate reductase [Ruminococcus sp.]|nr:pyrroline-5-carboxylate reductase [Ruminococcus sp.]
MLKIGFIGTGNMGGALIRNIMKAYGGNALVYAYDPDSEKLSALEKEGVIPLECEVDACRKCKYTVLAVKPQVFSDVLPRLAEGVSEDNVIISIAAGITEEYIAKICGEKTRTVIVMPNTPFLLGEGATALAKGKYTSEEEFGTVTDIFSTGGIAEVVPMDKMKEIIAVNGSSPAFIYLYAKGFIDYADSVGISRETALKLFAKSLTGAAKMMTDSGKDIDGLIKMVSSPGGTTLAGLDALYEGDLTGIVRKCCEKCTQRAYELERK